MKKKIAALFVLLAVLAGAIFFFFIAQKKLKDANNEEIPITIPAIGSIQVLNGCGSAGTGQLIADLIRKAGFDVKEIGNAPDWNYKETIVANRSLDTTIAAEIARILGTDNLIPLHNGVSQFDVTVFVGADYQKLLKPKKR